MGSHLTAMGHHLPYGITQCYLLPDTSECAPPEIVEEKWHGIYHFCCIGSTAPGSAVSTLGKLFQFWVNWMCLLCSDANDVCCQSCLFAPRSVVCEYAQGSVCLKASNCRSAGIL